jgi:hypothetical protein
MGACIVSGPQHPHLEVLEGPQLLIQRALANLGKGNMTCQSAQLPDQEGLSIPAVTLFLMPDFTTEGKYALSQRSASAPGPPLGPPDLGPC